MWGVGGHIGWVCLPKVLLMEDGGVDELSAVVHVGTLCVERVGGEGVVVSSNLF